MAIAAALSLVSVSSAGIAQSYTPAPATESVSGDNEIKGTTAIVGLLALAAIIAGAAIALGGSKKPTSP